jgi:hypothetical protein
MAANILPMSDASSPQAPPASADAERRAPAASFYRAETYRAEESIGYLMRRIVTAVGQSVETRMCEPGSPTYPQWVPLLKLHMGDASTVAELARACTLDAGAMTRLLDRLEAKGLVHPRAFLARPPRGQPRTHPRRPRRRQRQIPVRAVQGAERTPAGFSPSRNGSS